MWTLQFAKLNTIFSVRSENRNSFMAKQNVLFGRSYAFWQECNVCVTHTVRIFATSSKKREKKTILFCLPDVFLTVTGKRYSRQNEMQQKKENYFVTAHF